MLALIVGMFKKTGDDSKKKNMKMQDNLMLDNLPLMELYVLIDQHKNHLQFFKRWGCVQMSRRTLTLTTKYVLYHEHQKKMCL